MAKKTTGNTAEKTVTTKAKAIKKPIEKKEFVEQATEKEEEKLSVVLIIGNDAADLAELSINAWKKNFNGSIVLVGATMAKMNTIEHISSADENVNMANILQACVSSDLVSDSFILSPVSAFPIIPVPESLNSLLCKSQRLESGELVCAKLITEPTLVKQLLKEGISVVYNYETGLPQLMEKGKIVELFEKFNPEKNPTKVISLYNNFSFANNPPTPVDFRGGIATLVQRSNPDQEIIDKGLAESVFFIVKGEGFTEQLKKQLEKKLKG